MKKSRKIEEKRRKKKELKQKLFTLKHRKLIKVAGVITRGTKAATKGTLKIVARKLEEAQRAKAEQPIGKKKPMKKPGRETGGIMDLVDNL